MDTSDLIISEPDGKDISETPLMSWDSGILAAGIFGSSGPNPVSRYRGTVKRRYIRDIEQMPLFSPPQIDDFVANYIASNIGKTFNIS